MNELLKSKKFKIAAGIVGSFILALVIFGAGVSVGIHKARFSYRFGENYEKNFMGPRPEGPMGGPMGFFRDMEGRDFRNGHGIAGSIVSIADNTIVIKDKENKEISIAVTDKTAIKDGRDDLKITDLKQNERIVVIGKPSDNGVVNADLIRVFSDNQPNNGAENNNPGGTPQDVNPGNIPGDNNSTTNPQN
jgi:hypothetical protein